MTKNMVCNAKGEIASNEKFTRTHDARAIPKSELRQNDKTETGFVSESSGKNKGHSVLSPSLHIHDGTVQMRRIAFETKVKCQTQIITISI